MKSRPILFSGPMVRAILDGCKTQTRRVCGDRIQYIDGPGGPPYTQKLGSHIFEGGPCAWHCPYGKPGDRLWVRETWRPVGPWEFEGGTIVFQCDGARVNVTNAKEQTPPVFVRSSDQKDKWRPSIHLPRWASRITLEVTGVRVQRLNETSEADAIAEGLHRDPKNPNLWTWGDYPSGSTNPVYAYELLWNQINESRGFGWSVNPWVWVIEFRRIEKAA